MNSTPWYYNDQLWNDLSPKFNSAHHWNIAAEEVRMILDLFKPRDISTVLDHGCGQGRHTLELAKRSMTVTALDRNQFFLDSIGKKAKELNVPVRLLKADMKDFVACEEFDLILNLGSSFGYFENKSDNSQVLQNIHASLKTGGSLLIELYGKEVVRRMPMGREWTEIDGAYFLDDRRVDENGSRVINHCKIIRDGIVKEATFSLTIFSGAEFTDMLTEVGFSRVSLHGDLNGSPYDQHAKRLIVIATK